MNTTAAVAVAHTGATWLIATDYSHPVAESQVPVWTFNFFGIGVSATGLCHWRGWFPYLTALNKNKLLNIRLTMPLTEVFG